MWAAVASSHATRFWLQAKSILSNLANYLVRTTAHSLRHTMRKIRGQLT